jgi:hypothetical protein
MSAAGALSSRAAEQPKCNSSGERVAVFRGLHRRSPHLPSHATWCGPWRHATSMLISCLSLALMQSRNASRQLRIEATGHDVRHCLSYRQCVHLQYDGPVHKPHLMANAACPSLATAEAAGMDCLKSAMLGLVSPPHGNACQSCLPLPIPSCSVCSPTRVTAHLNKVLECALQHDYCTAGGLHAAFQLAGKKQVVQWPARRGACVSK